MSEISERARKTAGYLAELVTRYAEPVTKYDAALSVEGRDLFEREIQAALDAERAEAEQRVRAEIARGSGGGRGRR